jgi:hypothetical protein
MNAARHRTRTSVGMLADSEMCGARRRYARALAVIRRHGQRAVDVVEHGTRKQVELLCSDIARALPQGIERVAVEALLARAEAWLKFRARNRAYVQAQLVQIATLNEVLHVSSRTGGAA